MSTELSDPIMDSAEELIGIIKSTMTHGLCSIEFPNTPCMSYNNENQPLAYTKHYPWSFQAVMVVREDGYPFYW